MEEIDEATQTLINDAVAKALEEANKKHKSEEDRRATDAYKKGQEAAKEEARKAQMSEEEKHSFELKELQKQNEELLNTIKLRDNKEAIMSELTKAKVSTEFAKYFVKSDEEESLNGVKEFISLYNKSLNDAVAAKIPSNQPTGSDKSTPGMTKEQFEKLSTKERIALSYSNPKLYDMLSN